MLLENFPAFHPGYPISHLFNAKIDTHPVERSDVNEGAFGHSLKQVHTDSSRKIQPWNSMSLPRYSISCLLAYRTFKGHNYSMKVTHV